MIRHLTSIDIYDRINSDGVMKPRHKHERDRDEGIISFEKLNGNDIFVDVFREGKGWSKDQVVVGILVDEEKLKKDNFEVYLTDSRTLGSRKNSKYTTKYENITRYNADEIAENYIKIGEYIHVKGEIPIKYIEQVVYYR